MFGIDEAGKGPVLGSMFVSLVSVPNKEVLPERVADSKTLTDTQRKEIFTELYEHDDVSIRVFEIPPQVIDNNSMTDVTIFAFSKLVESLPESELGVVDASHPDEEIFESLIMEEVHEGYEIIAEHGADESYPVVSAASIVSKEFRERHMDVLEEKYEGEVGSGYPSDPVTREFLEMVYETYSGFPKETRLSWGTVRKIQGGE